MTRSVTDFQVAKDERKGAEEAEARSDWRQGRQEKSLCFLWVFCGFSVSSVLFTQSV